MGKYIRRKQGILLQNATEGFFLGGQYQVIVGWCHGEITQGGLRDAFQEKCPYGGTLSQLGGGAGKKKHVKCPNLKNLLTIGNFLGGEWVKLFLPFS